MGLALEAHGLWIPTEVYNDIIGGGVIPRGVKSSSFVVPKIVIGPGNPGVDSELP